MDSCYRICTIVVVVFVFCIVVGVFAVAGVVVAAMSFVFRSATLTIFVLTVRIHIRGVTYILLHDFAQFIYVCSTKAKAL